MNIKHLKQLLLILDEHQVLEYQDQTIKLTIKPKEVVRAQANDLSIPKKSKEQEAEELLFHSAGR